MYLILFIFFHQNVSVEAQFLCCLVYRRFVTVFHCGKLCSAHNFSKLCTKATVHCIISSKTVQSGNHYVAFLQQAVHYCKKIHCISLAACAFFAVHLASSTGCCTSSKLYWLLYFWQALLAAVLLASSTGCCTFGKLYWLLYFWQALLAAVLLASSTGCCTSSKLYWLLSFWQALLAAVLLASSIGCCTPGGIRRLVFCGGGVPPHYTWQLAGGSHALLAYQRGGAAIHSYVILAIAISRPDNMFSQDRCK